MTDFSDFVVLLARQRSGTNPLRSVLKTHPDIFCMPEIFNNRVTDEFEAEVNYATFVGKRFGGDTGRLLMLEDHETLFLDFLEYLRCFTDRRFIILDVKNNASHHVVKFWRFATEEPFLFTLMKKHGIRVLHLRRQNYLRYYLSETKANLTRSWEVFDEAVVGERRWYIRKYKGRDRDHESRIAVDIPDMLKVLALCRSDSAVVEDSFKGYGMYASLDYAEMFSRIGGPVADTTLSMLSDWLGVDDGFEERRPEYRKQSYLPLEETIENYPEVVAALRGTDFEDCLLDEPLYRASGQRKGQGVREVPRGPTPVTNRTRRASA